MRRQTDPNSRRRHIVCVLLVCTFVCFLWSGCAAPAPRPDAQRECPSPRRVLSFDGGWKFLEADAPGAERAGFDDSHWRTLDLPHDWSIAGSFDPGNPTGAAGGFLPSGVGWYRKRFSSRLYPADARVFIQFDGVMANSDVWINGFHLGRRPNGYVGFTYELTGHMSTDTEDNVVAVRADDSGQPASRWYTGAGIYRHVRLMIAEPVHVAQDATFVSVPELTPAHARVHVRTSVLNESDETVPVSVAISLRDPSGGRMGRPGATANPERLIASGQSADFDVDVDVDNPTRWDIDRPALCRASVRIESRGRLVDGDEVSFGIRDARFEAATGFWLNGRNVKIKGVCLHGDGGAFGAAVPLGVWRRRLSALRELGVNAIRTAHNPPDPGFLDLCDSMGFLVMDEMFDCWTVAKNPFDYHLYFNEWSKTDTRDVVRRDRNHPSIVLWSAGNEIHDTPQAELSKHILSGLVGVFHENDPTRPVTQALFRPNISHDFDDGLADLLDVIGTNYRNAELLAAHAARPERKIIGTEMGQALDVWKFLRDNAALSGQFLWVGVDYLGEAPRWPYIGGGGDQAGLLDRTGSPRPQAFQRQSWWSTVPMVYMARRIAPEALLPADPGYGNPPKRRPAVLMADWTPADGASRDETVEVYSNAEKVELFLNRRSLGAKRMDPSGAPALWQVPYEAGTLKAAASTGGSLVASRELRSAGVPARILLEADASLLSSGWDNVDFVRATVVDANGVAVPATGNLIDFHVDGPGAIAAVDNADNASHEPFSADQRTAYRGSCFAVLRATQAGGTIRVTASAGGLTSASLTIETRDGDR